MDAGSGTIALSGGSTAEHVYTDAGSGTISGGTSTTGSVVPVIFHAEIARPERGDHWTEGHFATQTTLARLDPPPPSNPVQVVTDVGLVVVFVVVIGISRL